MKAIAKITVMTIIAANSVSASVVSDSRYTLQKTMLGGDSSYQLNETTASDLGSFETLKYLELNGQLTPIRYNMVFNKTLGDSTAVVEKYFSWNYDSQTNTRTLVDVTNSINESSVLGIDYDIKAASSDNSALTNSSSTAVDVNRSFYRNCYS